MPLGEVSIITVGAVGPEPELLEVALGRASSRMHMVFDDGREAADDTEIEEAADWDDDSMFEEGSGPYSPNYVSHAVRIGDVVGIANIDTKGERYPWMFRTFLRIVAEELRGAQAVPARIIPFITPDRLAWMREHRVTYPSHSQLT